MADANVVPPSVLWNVTLPPFSTFPLYETLPVSEPLARPQPLDNRASAAISASADPARREGEIMGVLSERVKGKSRPVVNRARERSVYLERNLPVVTGDVAGVGGHEVPPRRPGD